MRVLYWTTTGVRYDAGRQRWVAYINIDGKQVRLGRFKERAEAVATRLEAEKSLGYKGDNSV